MTTADRSLNRSERSLLRDLYPALRRFAAVVAPMDLDPDDLLQEALFRVLRRGHLSELRDPGAYVRRTMVNLATSQIRQRNRRTAVLARLRPDTAHEDAYPSDVADLDQVDPRARAVLLLKEVDGVPYAEIGEMLGCSDATVRSIAARARRRLQQVLSDEVNDATA